MWIFKAENYCKNKEKTKCKVQNARNFFVKKEKCRRA